MEPIISAQNISFAYENHLVLQDLSFSVPCGQYTALIGPNGSGKTTLLNLLCGYLKPRDGRIFYQGRHAAKMTIDERAKNFAVIHQNETNQFPFTVLEVVLMGLHPYRSRFGRLTAEQYRQAETIMTATNTLDLAQKAITEISGGEFQRVILARALLQQPKVLFMDEAMADLDISARIKMIKLLKSLAQQFSMTIVAIDHDITLAYRYSDYVLALKNGRLTASGATKTVLTEAFFAEFFAVKAEIDSGDRLFIDDNLE